MQETCETCRFSAPSKDPKWSALSCRRLPPTAGHRPVWPHTYTDAWCGQYEPVQVKPPARKKPAVGEVETRGEQG